MSNYLVTIVVIALLLSSCPGGGADTGKTPGKSPGASNAGAKPTGTQATGTPPVKTADADPIQRGYDIFHTTEYSNTSLVCANCHANSERTDEERVYIASSGYGAASRGAWKISSQKQLDAGEGHVKSLIDAANICVKAPYLNHAEQLIEGSDADALIAYLESIAKDDEPFVIGRTKKMPVGGLLNDEENGRRIYSIGCKNCHDVGLEDVPELAGASDWLNALQVMAKVRKVGIDYYGDWVDMDYANYAVGEEIPVSGQAGRANPCGENPCGDNPCGEGHDHDAHGEGPDEGQDDGNDAGHDDDHGMFAEGAMPFYSTRILSDQDVVDVAYFISEKL